MLARDFLPRELHSVPRIPIFSFDIGFGDHRNVFFHYPQSCWRDCNLVYGWKPFFTEFSLGSIVLDVQWAVNKMVNSYRSLKFAGLIGKLRTKADIAWDKHHRKVYLS